MSSTECSCSSLVVSRTRFTTFCTKFEVKQFIFWTRTVLISSFAVNIIAKLFIWVRSMDNEKIRKDHKYINTKRSAVVCGLFTFTKKICKGKFNFLAHLSKIY